MPTDHRPMWKELGLDLEAHDALQFCSPYQIEAGPVERRLEREGLPTLRSGTDYGQEDVGQIRTRVEAFVERLRG